MANLGLTNASCGRPGARWLTARRAHRANPPVRKAAAVLPPRGVGRGPHQRRRRMDTRARRCAAVHRRRNGRFAPATSALCRAVRPGAPIRSWSRRTWISGKPSPTVGARWRRARSSRPPCRRHPAAQDARHAATQGRMRRPSFLRECGPIRRQGGASASRGFSVCAGQAPAPGAPHWRVRDARKADVAMAAYGRYCAGTQKNGATAGPVVVQPQQ